MFLRVQEEGAELRLCGMDGTVLLLLKMLVLKYVPSSYILERLSGGKTVLVKKDDKPVF